MIALIAATALLHGLSFATRNTSEFQATGVNLSNTWEIGSAVCGPIQLSYDADDLPVEVVFENIDEHAYWGCITDNDSFNAKLAENAFDWTEVATPSFEVHSKHEKMVASLASSTYFAGGLTPQ